MATDGVTVLDVGDVLLRPEWAGGQKRRLKETVQASCGGKAGRWYCATHHQGFANQLQKDIHIDNGRAHTLVWLCFEHGAERP